MNGAAEIRVRGEAGIFVAETCAVIDGLVTATGRYRRLVGAGYAQERFGPRETLSWPVRRVDRIRWLSPVA